ncbi:MAG: hypothetical protein OWS74_04505 [Firmicutes bacterium]|nr:hypothetical protein [Bacillota bacterium]
MVVTSHYNVRYDQALSTHGVIWGHARRDNVSREISVVGGIKAAQVPDFCRGQIWLKPGATPYNVGYYYSKE